jgi:hypothetical protein
MGALARDGYQKPSVRHRLCRRVELEAFSVGSMNSKLPTKCAFSVMVFL